MWWKNIENFIIIVLFNEDNIKCRVSTDDKIFLIMSYVTINFNGSIVNTFNNKT